MIAEAPTQEQVDQVARELAPDVVRIFCRPGVDMSGDPDVYFRVVLSDDAARRERLARVAEAVRAKLHQALHLDESSRLPYFLFRSRSEQESLGDRAWR